MGKIVTIYLSDVEARDLKGFCDASQCTQYSVLKTAVRQLLYRPVQIEEEGPQEINEEPEETLEEPTEENIIVEDTLEEIQEQPEEETTEPEINYKSLRGFLKYSRAREAKTKG